MKRYIANRSTNKSTSQDHYEVVKVSKWYDPEGLNIPDDDGKVQVSGTLEYCTDWLEDTYYDANQNNYIAVRNYEPGKSLQLYYFNSQSNVNYVIRKIG